MTINWYPGHMVTARKEAIVTLRSTDVVIEVLDARVPHSSCNPEFEKLRAEHQRPALKILNKADLADRALTTAWLAHYNAQPKSRAIALSAKKRGDVARIIDECRALAPTRKALRLMILGIPNVGKSSIMNALLQRKLQKVGDMPAVTKMQQRHEIDAHTSLVDTPGMMWIGVADDVAWRLAAANSIGPNAYDDHSVATELAGTLLQYYDDRLLARYGAHEADATSLFGAIAARRVFKKPGGAPDLDKAATVLLQDFRDGTLGPITLDRI
jgi:ribosome biogenesis GTPase A